MTVADILAGINVANLTFPELDEVIQFSDSIRTRLQTEYAKTFELGDVVKLDDGSVATVVRRNVHTVSVLRRGSTETEKITPSDIVQILEQGDEDNFDYWAYFG
ncbi:MAG: hypothetical protein VW443_04745 [Pseudomonadales bacterium]|jgi:hypothetical protein